MQMMLAGIGQRGDGINLVDVCENNVGGRCGEMPRDTCENV